MLQKKEIIDLGNKHHKSKSIQPVFIQAVFFVLLRIYWCNKANRCNSLSCSPYAIHLVRKVIPPSTLSLSVSTRSSQQNFVQRVRPCGAQEQKLNKAISTITHYRHAVLNWFQDYFSISWQNISLNFQLGINKAQQETRNQFG